MSLLMAEFITKFSNPIPLFLSQLDFPLGLSTPSNTVPLQTPFIIVSLMNHRTKDKF